MKSLLAILMGAVLLLVGLRTEAQEKNGLRLVQTIPMPEVKGRLDHMDVDVKGKRLFVAGLENGSLEVIDLAAGKRAKSIPGFKKPQGIAYVAALNKVFVASGDDGMVRVFRGDSLELVDSIQLDLGPNRVVYDPNRALVYVGYGGKDAGKDYGEVGIIDAKTDRHVGDIQVVAHPSELLLTRPGEKLFVCVSIASKVQVIDTKKREVVATWAVSSERDGDAALEEKTQRLFIGTRTPPQMIVMDSASGREIANLPTVEGMDGVYFNAGQKKIYVSGGRDNETGGVFVYRQKDADHYETVGQIPTRAGAGTSFWSPELNRYCVAAAAHGNEDAAILVFEPEQ